MSKIIEVKNYECSKEDVFIIDTNVYIYLYLNQSSNVDYIDEYTDFYYQIIESNLKILTTSIQISEFFNRYSKMRFEEYKSKINADDSYKYKYYKKTTDYLDVLNELKLIIQNRILSNSTAISDNFEQQPINQILRTGQPYDFNDEYLIHLALLKDAKIVTHDKGIVFHDSDVEVITAHRF